MKYLFTFASTTSAFFTDKMLKDSKSALTWELVSIPPALSNTCYGIGVQVDATLEETRKVYASARKQKISVKHCWREKGNEYVNADKEIMKHG